VNRKKKSPGWQTVPEVSLVYKPKIKAVDRPIVTCSEDIYQILKSNWDDSLIGLQEQAKLLLLNRKNRVLGIHSLGSGGISKLYIDPKLVFAAAIKSAASGIVLCHNHPSGDIKPGISDILLTEKIKKAATLLDIELLDHIIITADEYYSFADWGIL
jgi:DNA repair protein RadC